MKTSLLGGLCALVILLSPACDRPDPDIRVRRNDILNGHGRGRNSAGDTEEPPVAIPPDGLFLTAVAYPPDYDWRRDTARGDVRGRVLLLRMRDADLAGLRTGGRTGAAFDTLLALEAGAGRAVSLDPDRHQFCGGHLYTQCLTGACTVWRRDGRTLLLSPEREYLRGILPVDTTLYTLVQRLDAGGFTLRRNGKCLFQRDGGRIRGSLGDLLCGTAGALSPDSGQACFLYQTAGGDWMHVRGQEESAVPVPSKLAQVYDLRCFGGTVHLVGKGTNGREPIVYAGDRRLDWSVLMGTPVELGSLRLDRSDGAVSVVGNFLVTRTGRLYSGRWQDGRLLDVREGQRDWLEGGAWLQRRDGRIVAAHHGGTDYPLDGGGTLMMPACACVTPDALWLGLTVYGETGSPVGAGDDGAAKAGGNGSGAQAVLWVNGLSMPVGINGYLTSVTLLKP